MDITIRHIVAAAAMLLSATAFATPLTPAQALQRMHNCDNTARVRGAVDIDPVPVYTATTPTGTTLAYVFNRPGDGYVVLSADDVAAPVLGYADSGAFDPDNMPPAMMWWLQQYGSQIEYAASAGAHTYIMRANSERQRIEPMLTTAWDQIAPFNDQCPKFGNQPTYSGCVATSMAQVVKYWQYPARITKTITYTCNSMDKRLSVSPQDFHWDQMLDSYTGTYTDEQADAVAYLMKTCGYGARMEYSTTASSSLAMYIRPALVDYFGYDPNMRYEIRNMYSATQWDQMIYDNLLNVGPVIYGGTSMIGGGHSFVCDGYDGQGYYHFNWGWSGMSDGFFLLDALNPDTLGSGGGNGGGYNFSQDAVLGIQPPSGEPAVDQTIYLTQGGSLTGTIDGTVLTFGLEGETDGTWINFNPQTLRVMFGAIIESQTDPSAEPVYADAADKYITLKAGYAPTSSDSYQIDLAQLELADGTYRVTMATRIHEVDDDQWIPVRALYGYYNYIMLTKDGDSYTVHDNALSDIRIVDASIESDLYLGCMFRFGVTVSNDTDIELTRGIAPALFYQQGDNASCYFLGSSRLITIPPHTTVTDEWISDQNMIQQLLSFPSEMPLYLTVFDEMTYSFHAADVYKPVTMLNNPGVPQVQVQNLCVDGVEPVTRRVGNRLVKYYPVTEKLNIPISCDITLTGSIPFAYQAFACMLGGLTDQGQEVYTYNGEPIVLFSDQDGPAHLSTTLSFPAMEPGKDYTVITAYAYGPSLQIMGNAQISVRLVTESGINDITADQPDQDTPIYNMQGMYVGTDWHSLPAGMYIRDSHKIIKTNN